jgi:hypothetical protein
MVGFPLNFHERRGFDVAGLLLNMTTGSFVLVFSSASIVPSASIAFLGMQECVNCI